MKLINTQKKIKYRSYILLKGEAYEKIQSTLINSLSIIVFIVATTTFQSHTLSSSYCLFCHLDIRNHDCVLFHLFHSEGHIYFFQTNCIHRTYIILH